MTEMIPIVISSGSAAAVEKYNLTLNYEMCSYGLNTNNLLGYVLSQRTMVPNPERGEATIKINDP